MCDGDGFHTVIGAEEFVKTTELVEVQFEDDAAGLAWLLPRRRRSASHGSIAVAVLGKEFDFVDAGLVQRRTFIDVPAAQAPHEPRSRSAGSCPKGDSCWSVGTELQKPVYA